MSTMERILRLMAEKKASDVYLSAHSPALIKINGQCLPINNQLLPPEATRNLLAEVLPANRLQELDESGELNMAHGIEGVGNFRFSAMRQRGTIAAVIRFIANEIPPLASLQVPMILGDLIMEKRGLLLMVGATGAGKSTTLAAMMDHRNERMSGHILTIEDPVEFVFKNKKCVVNQREVGSDTHSLQTALKNALRQAPDVILVGEIRDRETMTAAIAYAQSGHLCLATMHANNSYQALNRILSFYPVEVRPTMLGDLAAAMKAIVSQRLLRTVDEATAPWGIKVTRIEIKDITPPADLVEAMASQMKAERLKRAQILEAEGRRQAEILTAEGEKQAQILKAEGQRQAAFLEAEARERAAQAEAEATRVVSEAIAQGNVQAVNYFVAQKYVEALGKLASADNSKVVLMPLEASQVIGAVGGIGEIVRATFDGHKG